MPGHGRRVHGCARQSSHLYCSSRRPTKLDSGASSYRMVHQSVIWSKHNQAVTNRGPYRPLIFLLCHTGHAQRRLAQRVIIPDRLMHTLTRRRPTPHGTRSHVDLRVGLPADEVQRDRPRRGLEQRHALREATHIRHLQGAGPGISRSRAASAENALGCCARAPLGPARRSPPAAAARPARSRRGRWPSPRAAPLAPLARAGNRRFGLSGALRAHTDAPCNTDPRAWRPGRA